MLHSSLMWQVPDLRLTWTLGAILILLGGFGVILACAVVGLPIILIAWVIGQPLDDAMRWVALASPLWAPLGAGMGMQVTAALVKGLRKPAKA